MESHKRSIAKAISWRIFAILVTVLIVYLFTKEVLLSISIGSVDAMIKILTYYSHERLWNRIGYGRRKRETEKVFEHGGGVEETYRREEEYEI